MSIMEYLKAIQIHLLPLEQNYIDVLSSFIEKQILESNPPLSNPKYNDSLKRKTLHLLILDISAHLRNEDESVVFKMISNHRTWQGEE